MGTRIRVICHRCDTRLSFHPEDAGTVGVCSECDARIEVPEKARMGECPDCGREVSRKATACPKCGCPIKESSFSSKLGSVAYMPGVDRMPTLKTRKSPVLAFILGCLFGCIGTGLYFRTFLDFFVPLIVFIVLSIAGVGIGGIPGWLFAGAWGLFRALDANRRLDQQ